MTSQPARLPKLAWVDVARGMAIALVVLHHAVVFSRGPGWSGLLTEEVNAAISAVRMPLFFVVSGLLAARLLRGTWLELVRRRVLLFAWLYVLWVLVRYTWFLVVPDTGPITDGDAPLQLVAALLIPNSGLWFIYALAVYSVLVKLSGRVPLVAQFTLAAALSVAVDASVIDLNSFGWRKIATYLVFFLAGVHGGGVLRDLAAKATPLRAVVLAIVSVGLIGTAAMLGMQGVPGVALLVSAVAVAASITVAAKAESTWGGRLLARWGSNTLPIYLVHVLVLSALSALLSAVLPPVGPNWGVLVILFLTAGGLAGSLVLRSLLAPRLPWAFGLPASVERALRLREDRAAADRSPRAAVRG